MAYLAVCVALAIVGSVTSQNHGHGHGHSGLHAICHSNHQQLTEDQVINRVVAEINTDPDGTVEADEMLLFVVDLMGYTKDDFGVDLQSGNVTQQDLDLVMSAIHVNKHDFTQAWHTRFHDSHDFIMATFDLFDKNGDGNMDGMEIEGIVATALATSDANQNGQLEEPELVNFLERIYKNC